jgi:hypothetical protein
MSFLTKSSCLLITLIALVGCSGAHGQQPKSYPQAAVALLNAREIGERVLMVDTVALKKLLLTDRVDRYVLTDLATKVGRPLHATPPGFTFTCEGGPCRLPGNPLVVTVLRASPGNGTAQIEVRYTYNIWFPDGTAVMSYDDMTLDLRRDRDGWVLTESRRVSSH